MKRINIHMPLGDNPPHAHLLYGVDVREGLSHVDAQSIHCVATSPPYWGLRDYDTPDTDWGGWQGQLGQEPTPDMFVEHIVEVFRAVKRVLHPSGTVWVNLGDTYAANRPYQVPSTKGGAKHSGAQAAGGRGSKVPPGLKPKDLVGIPWRVALALQADGWWLRNAIIWEKVNHMPSSVTDRLTCSYEFIFLFAQSQQYYFDLDAIRVPHTSGESERGKNPGDCWSIPTQPYAGAHCAVWPLAIPERIIRAATSSHGCCSQCHAPWEQEGEMWVPSCKCVGTEVSRCRVLDPFSGSGTTGVAAWKLNRDYVGVDLNAAYLDLAKSRLRGDPISSVNETEEGSVFDLFDSQDEE